MRNQGVGKSLCGKRSALLKSYYVTALASAYLQKSELFMHWILGNIYATSVNTGNKAHLWYAA